MPNNALQQALSQTALLKSWAELYQKTSKNSKNTTGVDGVSINEYEPHHKQRIAQLYRKIRRNSFTFHNLKPSFIPKAGSDKLRLINVPTVDDRIVQRALVNFLSNKYQAKLANEISYGFVKGRSVKEAATRACQMRKTSPWVFKTDITSFFDSISRDLMAKTIHKEIRHRSLHEILISALSCEVHAPHQADKRKLNKLDIHRGQGIRQGMPLSPLLSNLLLFQFDQALDKNGIKAVRYADDLIFFANNENECHEIEAFCRAEFEKLKLSIPAIAPNSKSIIYNPKESAEFLGLELALSNDSYELRLDTKQIDRIRNELLGFGSIKELLSRGITLKTLGSILTAKRSGYLAAYDACSNLEEVENSLINIEKRALRKLYSEGLNINLDNIDNQAKRFLGLLG